MIIDTSALVAVLRDEPERPALLRAIAHAQRRFVSAANLLETSIVIDARRDAIASRRLDEFMQSARVEVAPVTARQAEIARAAYRDFGRGSGHPARLNFGDCFAYALAKDNDQSLLFKGDDFSHTDVRRTLG